MDVVLTVVQVLALPGALETQCDLHKEGPQCLEQGRSLDADDSLAQELVPTSYPWLVATRKVSRGRRSSLA